MNKGLEVIRNMLYPEGIKCVICGTDIQPVEVAGVCKACGELMNTEHCKTCGRGKHDRSDYCEYCKEYGWSFSTARSLYNFDGQVRSLIYRFKYGGERSLCKPMAFLMRDLLDAIISQKKPDYITFVPLHIKRFKKRGYNQSQELAVELGKLSGIPVHNLLIKTTYTKNLASMTGKERQKAIANTFALEYDVVAKNSADYDSNTSTMSDIVTKISIKDKKILLIDDVFTTGSTANECAKTLKKGKAAEVSVLTFASLAMKPYLFK